MAQALARPAAEQIEFFSSWHNQAVVIFQGVHMKVMLLCALMCVAGALSADDMQPGDEVGEFFFSEIEGRKAGPNAFLRDHALQQAWPAHVDNAFRAEAARNCCCGGRRGAGHGV